MIAFAVLLTAALVVAWGIWADSRQVAQDIQAIRRRRPPGPESLEGVLVQDLLTHRITRAQYQRSMAAAAFREATRHPIHLPPDLKPPQNQ